MINKVSRASVRLKSIAECVIISLVQHTPRLAVFRSNNHMYAQIIDDTVGKTLVSASTLQKDVKAELEQTQHSSSSSLPGNCYR